MDAALVKKLAVLYAVLVAEADDFGKPNGHLYAMVAQPMGADLDTHNLAIRIAKDTGLVEEEHFLLTWAGTDEQRNELRAIATNADKTT